MRTSVKFEGEGYYFFLLLDQLSEQRGFHGGCFLRYKKEDGVEASSIYRDRYDVGRKCTSSLDRFS